VERLVLLDAPLPDDEFSEEFLEYARHEDELLEQGELYAAAVLNADFWLADRSLTQR
jgi:hypothetical protein